MRMPEKCRAIERFRVRDTHKAFSNGGSRPSKLEFVRACAIERDALASTFMRAKTTTEMTTLFRFAKTVAFLRRLFPGRSFVRLLIVAVLSGEIANAQDLKPGPHGIIALLPPFNSARRVNLARSVWSNPLVRGVRLRTVWRNVQPEENSFDWSYLDEAVALAARHDKYIGLSVAAGIFTPDWVYRGGAQRFDFTLTGPWRPTSHETMPEPWDDEFLKKWGATVRAMGRRYDGNTNVAYVVMGGLGFNIESSYVKTPEDIAKLQSLGGAARWLEGAKRIVDLYAEAFPTTPFLYAMQPPIKNDYTATRELVEYGVAKYPGHFGIMHTGLNAAAELSLYPNHAVQIYSAKTPAGFQMVWSTEGDKGDSRHSALVKRVKGTLAQALTRGAEFNGQFVEVYEVDCQNPALAGELREAGQRLAPEKRQPAQ
jgi:Beta-galactosidase